MDPEQLSHSCLQPRTPPGFSAQDECSKSSTPEKGFVTQHDCSCTQLKLHHSGQLLKKQMFYLINHNPSQQINAIYLGLKDDGY